MTIEKSSPEQLLADFRDRYQKIQAEQTKLKNQLQENEAVALKLLGAIETLSYLNDEPMEETTEESDDVGSVEPVTEE